MPKNFPTKREQLAKASLYEIGYEYLRDNFHKFTTTNKIRVALDVYKAECGKNLNLVGDVRIIIQTPGPPSEDAYRDNRLKDLLSDPTTN